MDKEQELRLQMVNGTCVFLSKHRAIWSDNVRVCERLEELIATRNAIQAANAAFVNGDTSSDTKAQGAALYRATELVLRLTHAVMEWALNQDNKSLQKLVDCSASDIRQLRQAEGIDRLNQLYAICETELPNIPGCGLSNEDLRAARLAIDEYVTLKTGKNQKRTNRKAERLNIQLHLSHAGRVLKQLDLLIGYYELSHPEFYREYKLTRKVLKTGGSTKKRVPGRPAGNISGGPLGDTPSQPTKLPPGPDKSDPAAEEGQGAVA